MGELNIQELLPALAPMLIKLKGNGENLQSVDCPIFIKAV